MVKICQTGLLKLNFETRPKKRIFRFLPKISLGHGWSWNFFFANFQILGPLGCQGWVAIPQNVKKSQNHCTLVCISGFIIMRILNFLDSFYSIYTSWDGLSQKTISRYCPFKRLQIRAQYLRVRTVYCMIPSSYKHLLTIKYNQGHEINHLAHLFFNIILVYISHKHAWNMSHTFTLNTISTYTINTHLSVYVFLIGSILHCLVNQINAANLGSGFCSAKQLQSSNHHGTITGKSGRNCFAVVSRLYPLAKYL